MITLHDSAGRSVAALPRGARVAFCRKVGGWLYGPTRCAAQSQRMRHLASDREDSVSYTCHAGLRCYIQPFVAGGKALAYAHVSGYRLGESPSEEVLGSWVREVGDTAILFDDFLALPRFSIEAEQHMIHLFKIVAEHAIAHGFVSAPRSQLFESIVAYIRSHIRRPSILIDDVAEHVNKSVSTVSHVVKKEAGVSFKRLVIEEKIDAAEDIMSSDTTSSIGKVAEMLGYSDQFYFSRVYKKYRGFPPKEFARRRMV